MITGINMSSINQKFTVISFLLISIFTRVDAAVWYVDSSAQGKGTGKSWTDAFTDLRKALMNAIPGNEIKIAQGTYFPADKGGDRNSSFNIPSGIKIIGGYSHGGIERDLNRYKVILSGDIEKDDYFQNDTLKNNQNNSIRVISCEKGDKVVLDGITVSSGYGIWKKKDSSYCGCSGSGIYALAWSWGNEALFEIKNCQIINNVSARNGAGVYFKGSMCKISDCSFSGNMVVAIIDSQNIDGGGISIESYVAEISGAQFQKCRAGKGGAVAFKGVNILVEKSLFLGNSAREGGGAISFYGVRCVVNELVCKENFGYGGIGGAILFRGNTLISERITAARNSASRLGGVIDFEGDSCIINGSKFIDNTSGESGGVCRFSGKILSIDSSSFYGNNAQRGNGGCLVFEGDSCSVYSTNFEGNRAEKGTGGALCVKGKTFRFDKLNFRRNIAQNGGAIFSENDIRFLEKNAERYAGIDINRSKFEKNRAENFGGAIAWMGMGRISDSQFLSNSAKRGGVIAGWTHKQNEKIKIGRSEIDINSNFIENEKRFISKSHIEKCVFIKNSAQSGAVCNESCGTFNKCIYTDNYDTEKIVSFDDKNNVKKISFNNSDR